MEIERGSEPLIAFLLVDQADHVSPAAKAERPQPIHFTLFVDSCGCHLNITLEKYL